MSYEKISAPFTTDFPNEWYDLNLTAHFWFAWRARVLQQLLAAHGIPTDGNLRALEIGCGVGFLRTQIETITSWAVDGVDLNEPAIQKAGPARGRTMLYNIHERLASLEGHYDVVFLFDVLEHIEDPERFLASAVWHVKPGGWVVTNTPALKSLYSRYDELVGHYQRYDTGSIRKLFGSVTPAIDVLDIRYWGLSLVPIAWLRKFVLRRTQTPQQAVSVGFETPAEWINQSLHGLMRIETALLQHPPIGSSIMALARKRHP